MTQLNRRAFASAAAGALTTPYLLRSGGKVGLRSPIRTFPVSLMCVGLPRTGGNAGLTSPMRTFPLSEVGLSEMTVGLSWTTILFMKRSICGPERHCSDLHVVRESLASFKSNPLS